MNKIKKIRGNQKKPDRKNGGIASNKSRNKKWELVLMGGGARGLAHIGVLEVLLENDLVPPVITGTSYGRPGDLTTTPF